MQKTQNPHLGRSAPELGFSLFDIGLANQQSNFPPQVNGTLSGSLAPNTKMLTHTGVRCRRAFSFVSRNDIPWYFDQFFIFRKIKRRTLKFAADLSKFHAVMFVLDPFGDQNRFQDSALSFLLFANM